MTTQEKVESIIQQENELPGDAQAELVEALLDIRAQQLGLDEDDSDL